MVIFARLNGATFGRMITIGRQNLLVRRDQLAKLVESHGIDGRLIAEDNSEYADQLFKSLGAEAVDAIDITSHEGAGIIHDMNRPVPKELHSRYDFLMDGGTIEHVFHAPTALLNYVNMLKVGGSMLIITAANNLMGHGIYQLSPEFFWSTLNESTGFQIRGMILFDVLPWGKWYAVADPAEIRARVELTGCLPRPLAVFAKKVSAVELDENFAPIQSDYSGSWISKGVYNALAFESTFSRLASRLKMRWPLFARACQMCHSGLHFFYWNSIRNKRLFRRIPKHQDAFCTTEFIQ